MACKKARTDQYSVSLLQNNNLIDTCRLCLQDRKRMLDLFKPERNFVEKIHFCTGIRISENPKLSSSICRKCDYELTVAHKFKTTCLNTLDVFQTLGADVDTDKKYIVKIDSIANNEPPIIIKTNMELKYQSDDDIDLDEVIQSIGFGSKKDDTDSNDIKYAENDIKYDDMIDDMDNIIHSDTEYNKNGVKYEYKIIYNEDNTVENNQYVVSNLIYDDNETIQDKNDTIQENNDVVVENNDISHDEDEMSDDNNDIVISEPDGDPDSHLIIKKVKSIEKGEDERDSKKTKVVLLTQRYCSACDRSFESARKFKAHRLVYHSGERHICDVCGRSLKHIASFNSHMKKHLTEPKHMCDQCDYQAYTTTDLHKHMRVHTGEKNYICSFCSERFRWPSSLTSHENVVHRKEKSHFCTKCDASFYTNHNLMMHMDSHDNIKRYQCEVCQTWLSRRCHYKAHLKKVHDIDAPKRRRGKTRT